MTHTALQQTGKIRPLAEDDILDIALLRQKTFGPTRYPSVAELGSHIAEMFLHGPWHDEGLPSLVYEDGDGRPVGFLGIFPRRMLLGGEPIRVAIVTLMMVEPASRGGVSGKLLQECFRGPQDLSLADWSHDVSRHVWEKAGGKTALLYSLYWTRPLHPWRYAAAGIGGPALQRILRGPARPLLAIGDVAAARLAPSWFRQTPPATPGTELSVRAMVEHWPTMTQSQSLVGQVDEEILEYVLREAARKREFGLLQRVLVSDESDAAIGWYIYYVNAGGIGQVLNVAAAPGKHGEVLDHMFYHAWRRGVLALQGRLEPQLVRSLKTKRCVLLSEGPWTIVHSPRPDVLAAIERGEALISRLDGEFWMVF